jgi:hypothetical protein
MSIGKLLRLMFLGATAATALAFFVMIGTGDWPPVKFWLFFFSGYMVGVSMTHTENQREEDDREQRGRLD